MKRVFVILSATIVPVLLAMTAVTVAQQRTQSPEGNGPVWTVAIGQSPARVPPPPPGDFVFISSEIGFHGKLVKGAPYSGQAVTETIQTLGDGNRIVNKSTSTLYRDSEGRTRREQTLKGFHQIGDGGEPIQTIFIHDPVSGVSYTLDTRRQVAYKTSPFKFEFKPMREGAPGVAARVHPEGETFEYRVEGSGLTVYGIPKKGPGPEAPAGAAAAVAIPPAGEKGQFVVTAESGGAASYVFSRKKNGPDPNAVTEKLGTQLIEGVSAEGTRTTITIPAGEIGNERAIEIVSERWYSAELQVVVMTRHHDPRFGETTYKLTNINRLEPAKTLFEVPGGYEVKDAPMPAGPPKALKRVAKPE
jgi:hypothetical protein